MMVSLPLFYTIVKLTGFAINFGIQIFFTLHTTCYFNSLPLFSILFPRTFSALMIPASTTPTSMILRFMLYAPAIVASFPYRTVFTLMPSYNTESTSVLACSVAVTSAEIAFVVVHVLGGVVFGRCRRRGSRWKHMMVVRCTVMSRYFLMTTCRVMIACVLMVLGSILAWAFAFLVIGFTAYRAWVQDHFDVLICHFESFVRDEERQS
jgi:hypothetical protein